MTRARYGFRAAVGTVALLNLAYFGVEFGVASRIGSVALFADSVDFLEDAAVNLLILLALRWNPGRRARLGVALSGILLIPAAAALVTAWQQVAARIPPSPGGLSLAGLGALLVNVSCALILSVHRKRSGSLTRAAFLSARNDAVANVAIIAAGLATLLHASIWPDLLVGIGVAAMNIDAAREVYRVARSEMAAPVA